MENTKSLQKRNRRRCLEDLTPDERKELYKHNLQVAATVPPKLPRVISGEYDAQRYEVRDRYEMLNYQARALRSDWLKAHRLTLKEALRMTV